MTTSCAVYRAEERAWARLAVFREPVADPQAFVDWVTSYEPFLRLRDNAPLPREHVTVALGAARMGASACANLDEQHIELRPGVVPTQGLLLHEIAHLCSPADAHHDPRYAANYLSLVTHWLGALAGEVLLRELRQEKLL